MYPEMFTDGELDQDVYFFALSDFPTYTPLPTTGPGASTLSTADRQGAVTRSGDILAGGFMLFAVLGFIGLVMAIFGRMGKG
jgi:hypothetical protein